MKVLIYTHDPMLTLVRLPNEAIELFGEDSMDDAVEIPDTLAMEITQTYKRLCELSAEVKRYRK